MSTERILEECPICYDKEGIDRVFLTCAAKHSICFKCALDGIEHNKKLNVCPLCKGGTKYIIIGDSSAKLMDFYNLSYFKKLLPILIKIINDKSSNTCLISEDLLLSYIENKKQLEIASKLLDSGLSVDDIFNTIKWTKLSPSPTHGRSTAENIFDAMLNELNNPVYLQGFGELIGAGAGLGAIPGAYYYTQSTSPYFANTGHYSQYATQPGGGPHGGPHGTGSPQGGLPHGGHQSAQGHGTRYRGSGGRR